MVQARAALEMAEKPLALLPRALGELGGMVRQALPIAPCRVLFRLVDPRELLEEG